jgi:hypothetical protein
MRQGAGWTSERHPVAVWSRRSPGLGSVRLRSCRGLLIAPGGVCPAEPLDTIPPVGFSSQWSGCQDAWLLAIAGLRPRLGVHPTQSAVRGPGVQLSGSRCPAVWGPGVQPSGVQPVQCPVVWLPRPDAAVQPVRCLARPASSRLVSVRRSQRLVPRRPGGRDGGHLGTAGQRSRLDPVELHVVRPRPRRLSRQPARGGLDAGTAAEVVWRPAGGRRPRTGRVMVGREAAPDRPGRAGPPRGRPVAGDCGRAGELAGAMLRHGTVWAATWGLGPRLLCVVVAGP